jgi:hypothetical protein
MRKKVELLDVLLGAPIVITEGAYLPQLVKGLFVVTGFFGGQAFFIGIAAPGDDDDTE